jgi:hypothetical protein
MVGATKVEVPTFEIKGAIEPLPSEVRKSVDSKTEGIIKRWESFQKK